MISTIVTTEQEQDTAMAVNPVVSMIRGMLWDVGLPIITYYALHIAGASDWAALLAASGVAAVRIGWTAVRDRRLNQFALVMLLVYGLSFALAFLTGDPRLLLLKSSFITGAVGLVFLISAIHGKRPLTLSAAQSFNPSKADEILAAFHNDPGVRHGVRLTSTVWGVGLLAEALVRIPLVFLLPIDIAYGVTEAMFIAAFVLLGAWTAWYMRQHDYAR